jgi:hypothetical protein
LQNEIELADRKLEEARDEEWKFRLENPDSAPTPKFRPRNWIS